MCCRRVRVLVDQLEAIFIIAPKTLGGGAADLCLLKWNLLNYKFEYKTVPRTVNGTGHTGPSEFCATSI